MVYPKGRWSLALFRHELASFEFTSETQGLFSTAGRFADQRSALDLEIETYGVAAAVRLHESVSLGVSVGYHLGSMSSTTGTYHIDEPTMEAYFGPVSYLPERLEVLEAFVLDDSDWRVSVGLTWRFAEGWRLGVVVRPGPTFELQSEAGRGLPPGPSPGTFWRG